MGTSARPFARNQKITNRVVASNVSKGNSSTRVTDSTPGDVGIAVKIRIGPGWIKHAAVAAVDLHRLAIRRHELVFEGEPVGIPLPNPLADRIGNLPIDLRRDTPWDPGLLRPRPLLPHREHQAALIMTRRAGRPPRITPRPGTPLHALAGN